MKEKKYLFLHVPKAAGSMFRDIVRRNFGDRPYRTREVMVPWSNCKVVPNWEVEVPLKIGISKVFKKFKEII